MKNGSEEIRLRYLYRKLIVTGKARVSLEAGRALVGPDCAYHLYGVMKVNREKRRASSPSSQKQIALRR